MKTYSKDIIQPTAIGYWKSEQEPDLPDPHDFIGLSISVEQRQALIRYLKNGLPYIHYLGHSFCRFSCGKPDGEMGCADLTDGFYGWPEGLSHYIKEHGVWLPKEFVEHATNNMNFDKTELDCSKIALREDTWWKCFKYLHIERTTSAFKNKG